MATVLIQTLHWPHGIDSIHLHNNENIVLSVRFQFTDSYYPFGILKLFFLYRANHISSQALTSERMISSGTTSPPAEVLSKW